MTPEMAGVTDPPPDIRPTFRIVLNKSSGPQANVVDSKFDLLRNLMTIVSAAGLDDPSSWNLFTTTGRIVMRTEELKPGNVCHVRGNIVSVGLKFRKTKALLRRSDIFIDA
jgi:hypothetical protein